MLKGLIEKIKSIRKPEPSEIIGSLIKADELCKIEPRLIAQFPMTYQQYREALKREFGADIANEIANTLAVGDLTIEQHARKMVRVYYENRKSENWYVSILDETLVASSRAYQAYGN
ncbi:hypothetical protein [Shewanella sp. cp20]|uniref:hypothetical protein n=1 Tax=Shewanella sp. cp20 TaxID=1521167 RepID=UPI0005A2882B|nr:hypothetical protein [Shewanella sp. cp20]KIO35674.1 hypothetical protein DB48_15420 [Shewanella sp. cp20]